MQLVHCKQWVFGIFIIGFSLALTSMASATMPSLSNGCADVGTVAILESGLCDFVTDCSANCNPAKDTVESNATTAWETKCSQLCAATEGCTMSGSGPAATATCQANGQHSNLMASLSSYCNCKADLMTRELEILPIFPNFN